VKLFGIRINLDEIELLLKDTLGGKTFICLDLNDKHLAVLYTDHTLAKEEIVQALKAKLHLHASSIKIIHMTDVPLTANGKVNYPLIKESLEMDYA
jgi:acyl-CoA synthetase (AMP-forming)/AMP-acid ligase II